MGKPESRVGQGADRRYDLTRREQPGQVHTRTARADKAQEAQAERRRKAVKVKGSWKIAVRAVSSYGSSMAV